MTAPLVIFQFSIKFVVVVVVVVAVRTIGSLSKDIFERRRSTGSEAFFLFICLCIAKFLFSDKHDLFKRLNHTIAYEPQSISGRRFSPSGG